MEKCATQIQKRQTQIIFIFTIFFTMPKKSSAQVDNQPEPSAPMDIDSIDPDKIQIISTDNDPTALTFSIKDEDHTLGNSLRYIVMRNPKVEFCGYSIPHPSEPRMNFRIQTSDNQTTATKALDKGLQDLMEMCNAILDRFDHELKRFNASKPKPEDLIKEEEKVEIGGKHKAGKKSEGKKS